MRLGCPRFASTSPIVSRAIPRRVHVSFGFEVFENEWTLVPVLSAGVALTHVSVNGQMVELVERHGMLHWSTDNAGRYQANLSYRVDARHFETGRTLAVPVPSTVATGLRVYFPDTGVDLAVLPRHQCRHRGA